MELSEAGKGLYDYVKGFSGVLTVGYLKDDNGLYILLDSSVNTEALQAELVSFEDYKVNYRTIGVSWIWNCANETKTHFKPKPIGVKMKWYEVVYYTLVRWASWISAKVG